MEKSVKNLESFKPGGYFIDKKEYDGVEWLFSIVKSLFVIKREYSVVTKILSFT